MLNEEGLWGEDLKEFLPTVTYWPYGGTMATDSDTTIPVTKSKKVSPEDARGTFGSLRVRMGAARTSCYSA